MQFPLGMFIRPEVSVLRIFIQKFALLKILKTFAPPRPSCDSKLAPLLRLAWCAYSWFACVDASRCCCCFLCTQMWPPFPPSEQKKEVTEEVGEHVLHGISWSGQILSFRFVLIVTVIYPVSWRFFSAMMFPRRSLFIVLFAAGNTHIVAKSLLVCVLYGYNDRLKRFLSFSVRWALQLAAVSSQVHVLLINFNEHNEWQAECPLWPVLDAEWLFLYLRLSQAHRHVSFGLSRHRQLKEKMAELHEQSHWQWAKISDFYAFYSSDI